VDCTASDNRNRTASCSITVRVTKAPSLIVTRFLAFGDSITAGEVTFPVGTTALGQLITKNVFVASAAYPTVLAKNLIKAYPLQEDAIAVPNYGAGGEKAADARARFLLALNTVRPQVVLLMEGANDIPLGEDGAASTAASEIRIMASEARARGMLVYLATLPPARPGGNHAIKQVLLDDYNGRMRDAAIRSGSTLVDVYSALLPGVFQYIGVDGLHPTELGYAKIAETFEIAIRTTLEAK
jgi:lysophospholipase L1-like esterase